jgi:hypothetical protein
MVTLYSIGDMDHLRLTNHIDLNNYIKPDFRVEFSDVSEVFLTGGSRFMFRESGRKIDSLKFTFFSEFEQTTKKPECTGDYCNNIYLLQINTFHQEFEYYSYSIEDDVIITEMKNFY